MALTSAVTQQRIGTQMLPWCTASNWCGLRVGWPQIPAIQVLSMSLVCLSHVGNIPLNLKTVCKGKIQWLQWALKKLPTPQCEGHQEELLRSMLFIAFLTPPVCYCPIVSALLLFSLTHRSHSSFFTPSPILITCTQFFASIALFLTADSHFLIARCSSFTSVL